jgi:hypothetical protein
MNACQLLVQNKDLIHGVGLLVVLGVEFWMGKTDKVQASSILELALGLLTPKKSPEDSENGKAL